MTQYTYSTYRPPNHRMRADETPEHKFMWVKRLDHLEPDKDRRLAYQAACTCRWRGMDHSYPPKPRWTSRKLARVQWLGHRDEALKQGQLIP